MPYEYNCLTFLQVFDQTDSKSEFTFETGNAFLANLTIYSQRFAAIDDLENYVWMWNPVHNTTW